MVFAGVGAKRFNMDACHRDQIGMSRLVVVIEERTVLIVVGVEVFSASCWLEAE